MRRFTSGNRSATFAVAIGGGLGALARYELGLSFARAIPPAFPLTTFVINVTGVFVLGLVMTLILEFWPPTRYVRPFFAIGVLGGYTTFSTFMVESARLIQTHLAGRALLYVALSLGVGLAAVFAGAFTAELWPFLVRRRRR
ncbi:MAG: fluoride efflux transporter CrcB [Actinomycetota bacterium]